MCIFVYILENVGFIIDIRSLDFWTYNTLGIKTNCWGEEGRETKRNYEEGKTRGEQQYHGPKKKHEIE